MSWPGRPTPRPVVRSPTYRPWPSAACLEARPVLDYLLSQQPVEKGVTPDLIRGPRSTRGVYSARKAWIPAGVETRRRRAGMTTRAGFCARTFFNGQPSRLCGLCDSLWLVLPLRAVHPVRGRAACVGWVAWPRKAWPWDDECPPASPGHAHASVGMPPGAGGSRRAWICHPDSPNGRPHHRHSERSGAKQSEAPRIEGPVLQRRAATPFLLLWHGVRWPEINVHAYWRVCCGFAPSTLLKCCLNGSLHCGPSALRSG